MVRVKRGVTANKTRRNILKQVKGFRFSRGNKERAARDAIHHAGNHAFAHRRRKKSDFRRLFTVRLNGALRTYGVSYSTFIDTLNKKNIVLDRKVLSQIAADTPETFGRIVAEVTGASAPKVEKKAPEQSAAKGTSTTQDDLTKVEGVGPKIAAVFAQNGIVTFKDLANADVEKLRTILEENKLASHDPTTWSEQADMAANGEWDELKKWQDEHLAGRA